MLLFLVMLTIASGNTALQSVLPALGRLLGVVDSAVAAVFSISALLWVIAAPIWANRSDRRGRKAMVLLGLAAFTLSLFLCGMALIAGINAWIGPVATFLAFTAGRIVYGGGGSAAPPAVQALVALRTPSEERTRALSLLASAFGLGTILGPAIAPYLVLGALWSDGPRVGLAGPALLFSGFGLLVWLAVARWLAPESEGRGHGAATSYPSIGGQLSGASVTAATTERVGPVGYFDARIRGWIVAGLAIGHAQAIAGQTIGFLVIDRLGLPPLEALPPTGLVLMTGAGSALLAQWGLIPIFNLRPRAMVLLGALLGAAGCVATGLATSLYGIATGFALASLGFGFARPGFTAGASLAVGPEVQGSVAGKVTSVNGAAYVLGPTIGILMYQLARPLPYLAAAAALLVLLAYGWFNLSRPHREAEASREQ
ncbi:MFS transporter [Stakelama tenebrarum]|nr:MFS transporter [Sphingosinithalassobacter tenebrarum]